MVGLILVPLVFQAGVVGLWLIGRRLLRLKRSR